MKNINITFLGTGTAVPTPSRNHSAILLDLERESILVDCGEGTQTQFRKAKISPHKLSKILITHWHDDHVLGLPGLFKTLNLQDYKKTLHIYGPKGIKNKIKTLNKISKINISLKVHELSSQKIKEKHYTLSALPMKHTAPCLGYSISLPDKRRLDKSKLKKLKLPNSPLLKKLQLGKSVKYKGKTISAKSVSYIEPGKKLTIILDIAPNANAIKLAKSSDLLIIESSFLDKDKSKAKEKKHLTVKQAAEIAKKAKVKSLILTHISQRYKPTDLEKEAKKIFKNTKIAKDLLKVSI